MKRKKLFGILIALIILALGAMVFVVQRLIVSDMCDNKIVKQVRSPTGDLQAIVFTRDCGATTRESFQVSILNKGDTVSDADTGNVFVSYGCPSIRWKDERTLLITKELDAQVFHAEKNIVVLPQAQAITVEYASKQP